MKTKKLRIGLLLNSFEVRAWEAAVIKRIVNSNYAQVVLTVLNKETASLTTFYDKFSRNRKRLVYLLYTKMDRKIFPVQPDAFERINLQPFLESAPVISVIPVRKRFSDCFQQHDIDTIKHYQIDVLIRMGFRILRGEILTSSKYGVWSYHHGDNTVNRGGPPGFWESVNDWCETGSILQILNEDLDNGRVLYRSWSVTNRLSPNKNKNNYFWKSASFLPRRLEELHREGEEIFFERMKRFNKDINVYSHKLYQAPSNITALKIMFKQILKMLTRLYARLFVEQWFLMFDIHNDNVSSFRKFRKILPPQDRFWADPHPVLMDERYYIFIEEFLYPSMKAHIAVFELNNEGVYTNPVKVLEKPYSLSYPFVFEWKGTYYMIPESRANRTIELYECVEFPTAWEHRCHLIENVQAADTTLFYYQDIWWLFTNIMENEGASYDDELFLFYADNLFSGEWKAHPLNPIVSDVKRARSAGKIFEKHGRIYRPSQDCSCIYGRGFNINEITILTETAYEEHLIDAVKPDWEKSIERAHTFSNEGRLTIIDACMRKMKLF